MIHTYLRIYHVLYPSNPQNHLDHDPSLSSPTNITVFPITAPLTLNSPSVPRHIYLILEQDM